MNSKDYLVEMDKSQRLTICKLHCGCSGVRCLCSFLDRHVLQDTDALRNPQRQHASDRYTQGWQCS